MELWPFDIPNLILSVPIIIPNWTVVKTLCCPFILAKGISQKVFPKTYWVI